MRRWKSCIFTVPGQLVKNVVVFRDAPIVTLVPYKGATFIADVRRFPAVDGDDRVLVPEAVEALKEDFMACFPSFDWRLLDQAHVRFCLKTEADLRGTGITNQNMVVFDHTFHNVHGLWVVFPGKASLMFALAREVVARMTNEASLEQEEVA